MSIIVANKKELVAFFQMVLLVGVGFSISFNVDMIPYQSTEYYNYLLYTLLAIGLYSSVYGIDLENAKTHKYLILNVVTIGVILKIVIIGGILYLLLGTLDAFIYAVIVAQIDPLSVSALTSKKTGVLSKNAKNILLAWASFDDPITVIVSILIASYILSIDGINQFSNAYIFLGNFILPALIYLIYRVIRLNNLSQLLLLGIVFGVCIYFGLMLSIAIVAIFLRPKFTIDIDYVVQFAYIVALILLGTYLTGGFSFILGFSLAFSAILSQALVSLFFTKKLSKCDSIYLSFAQQNGITAVILSLLFEPYFPGVITITAFAIIVINAMHIASFILIKSTVCKNYHPE